MPDHSMSQYTIRHRPALAAKEPLDGAGVRITALPEGHVIEVLATNISADIGPGLEVRTASDAAFAVRRAGPGQWFIVGDNQLSEAETVAVCAGIGGKADFIDQSHGRVRIHVSGAKVEQMLAKGTAVDLAVDAFPVGHTTTTLIGHIAAHITRTDADAFEIMVLRGFAESLWDDLALMSREFL